MFTKPRTVVEFGTGYLLSGESAVAKKLRHEAHYSHCYGGYVQEREETVYFAQGKEPNCAYIIRDRDGKLHYMKHQGDIEVDYRGEPLVAKKK